jgi:hypothetical protein
MMTLYRFLPIKKPPVSRGMIKSSEVWTDVLNWQGAEYTLQTQPPAIGSHSPHLQQRCSFEWNPTSSTVLQLPKSSGDSPT